MDPAKLEGLLNEVAAGRVTPGAALNQLRALPFENMGFARLDHHRLLRTGRPEVIYCAGKTPEQVVAIVESMHAHGMPVLGTRCDAVTAERVCAAYPDAEHHASARAFVLESAPPVPLPGVVAVVCAGTSDLPVADEAAVTAAFLGCRVERMNDIGVAGLHRLLERRAALEDATVIIACAGMEGALPSVLAGLVSAPVIAVPTSVGYGASFGGLAALLAMLNSCASGVTVTNIDNGYGAAVAAAAICRAAGSIRE